MLNYTILYICKGVYYLYTIYIACSMEYTIKYIYSYHDGNEYDKSSCAWRNVLTQEV